MRYACNPELERQMTQDEVAQEMGISLARVGQLERSALRKLRALPEARELLQHSRFIFGGIPARVEKEGTK